MEHLQATRMSLEGGKWPKYSLIVTRVVLPVWSKRNVGIMGERDEAEPYGRLRATLCARGSPKPVIYALRRSDH
jgi:hypothetical protein